MKIVFMGTPQAAVPTLERILRDGHEVAAVYAQPDKPSGRGNKITFSPVKECALRNDICVEQPAKIKTPAALETFRAYAADVAVVVAYGRILPASFLTAFPGGAINVHFSLLPKYRGAAPVNWAIVNGETVTGVTTMQMDEGLDTGAILLQKEIQIGADENAVELMARLAELGADALAETLAMRGELTAQPQNDAFATFAPLLKKEDGKIEWNSGAAEIANRVRGFQPFPTAFTLLDGRKITVWKCAEAFEIDDALPESGAVVHAKGDDLIVKCAANSLLRITELQPEGKRRMPTRDFLNGAKINIGDKLGQ